MELDLQSLFWAPVYSCTHWQRPRNSPPPPHLGSYARALLVSQDRRHLFCNPLISLKQQTIYPPRLRGVPRSSSLGVRQTALSPPSTGVPGAAPPSKGVSAERTVLGEPGVLGVRPPPPLLSRDEPECCCCC
jgi:hypothetical protein